MSLLAKEISEKWWVVSFAKLRALWHVTIRFKASITRQHKPVVILPSSFCVEMFTRPLSCCRCDQLLLWYEVTVKICQCLSAKTALSCLCAKNTAPSKCVTLFSFCRCLKISFRNRDAFGTLWCVGIFLCHVIFMVKHIYKSTQLLSGWTAGVSKTK